MENDWQSIYSQLGALVTEMPKDLDGVEPVSDETFRWLGRVSAILHRMESKDTTIFDMNVQSLTGALRPGSAVTVRAIAFRALSIAESNAPAAAQGAFVPVGRDFDAFAAIGKILAGAKTSVLIVDPYMDEKALTDFAPLAPERVEIRLLADEKDRKPSLAPAAERWRAQWGTSRPLVVRVAPARTLHDRLIVVDDGDVWALTQSLNAFAARSPAAIVRVDAETAVMKRAAFDGIWTSALPA